VTLVVFAVFSMLYLREPLGWNHAIGFALIAAGAAFVFSGRPDRASGLGLQVSGFKVASP
jgi:drug/metabolite transporter (DMT)-like permease